MAKAVFLCTDPSLGIEEKILRIKEGESLRIGRRHGKETVLSSNGLLPHTLGAVSYHHALIFYLNEEFYIEDNSRNGTFINGYKIKKNEKHWLLSGDVIQLGSETFTCKVGIPIPTFYVKLFKSEDKNFEYLSLLQSSYSDPMQLYQEFPKFHSDIESLHLYIRERFQVLQILDYLGDFGSYKNNILLNFLSTLKEKNLSNMLKLITGISVSFEEELYLQRLDHVSHYIICLSCCQNFVLKKWFIDQEVKLLQVRWYFLHDQDKTKLSFHYFSGNKVQKEVMENLALISEGFIDLNSEYFKLPVTSISSLVRTRNVFVWNGYGFVQKEQLIYAFVSDLEKLMKVNLESMHTNLHHIWQDERIISIIHWVSKEININRYLFDNKNSSSVIVSEIDKLAKESFPLCMNELHYKLRKHKHLRNAGRFQYGLFLKGIGLSLQDSITFWRSFFTQKITLDEFFRHYQYHIQHSYGVVGKMADYPPQSCKKILEAVPSYDEYHGCPFKTLKDDIIPLLRRNKISFDGEKQILEMMDLGMPQAACKVYFNEKHSSHLNEATCHPNKYFNNSRELLKQHSSSKMGSAREQTEEVPSELCAYSKKFDW